MNNLNELQRPVRALYAITDAMNGSLSLRELLTVMLERTVAELGYKAATVRLLDEERQQLELKAAYGLSIAYLQKGPVEVGKSGLDQTVLRGTPVAISDIRHDPGFQYAEAAIREGLASVLAVPLRVHAHVIGVLRVYTAEPHQFVAEERAFLAAVANLGAQEIQRTRLYEAFQAIAQQVNSSLDFANVLTALLFTSVTELQMKAGSIRLLGTHQATLHLAAAYGLSASYLQKGTVEVAHSPIDQWVLADMKPLAITEVSEIAGLQYPQEAQREGIRSILVLPLCVHATAIGVLRLYSGQTRQFSSEEIAFASAVANLGALAIENAKLHAALKERLETIQADTNAWYRFLALS